MTANVLIEAYNSSLSSGTGIATYIRNLATAVRANGYSVAGLLHSFRTLPKRDPILSEILFFDALNRPSNLLHDLQIRYRQAIGVPFGIGTTPLHQRGFVLNQDATKPFDQILVARMFQDFARLHFRRYGIAAQLKVSDAPRLFHATQVLPLKLKGAANVYTIHDVVPLRIPSSTLDDKHYFLRAVRHLCAKADHIVTVSEASKADIIALTGISERRITNTYQAVSLPKHLRSQSADSVADAVLNLFGLTYKEYFLFCGALEPKKNISRLVHAYTASGTRCPLIIAGPLGWQYEQDLNLINDDRFENWKTAGRSITRERRVRRIGYLPFEQLMTLIRGAKALLFPSLYEGFGLPVLEAMLLGTPVIASNVPAIAEIAGDAAQLVDPLDTDSIASAIRHIDADADLRGQLSSRGFQRAKLFSPEIYKERIASLYKSIGN